MQGSSSWEEPRRADWDEPAALSLDRTGSNPSRPTSHSGARYDRLTARPSEVGRAALHSSIQHMAKLGPGDRGRMSARPSEAPKGDGDEGKCDRHGGRRMPRSGLWRRLRAPPGDHARRRISRRCRWCRTADRGRVHRGRPSPSPFHGDVAGQCDAQARGMFAGRCWSWRDVHDAAHDGFHAGERYAAEPASRLRARQRAMGSGCLVEFRQLFRRPYWAEGRRRRDCHQPDGRTA